MQQFIKLLSRPQYEQLTHERAEEGLGPFLGTYENYLQFVEAHNQQLKESKNEQ